MKNKLLLSILFLNFISLNSHAQNKNVVIADEDDKSSLPYATIKVLNKNKGYYSDINGVVIIPEYNSDSLLIEYSGYFSCKLIIKKNVDTIFLKRKVTEMPNVVVLNLKNKHEFGIFNYKKSFIVSFPRSMEYAIKLDLSEIKGDYKVKELFLPMGYNNKVSNDCNCKLHLYRSDENGFPVEDVLNKPVILRKEYFLNNNFNIDISDQNLFLSEKILFIGIECILSPLDSISQIAAKNNFKQPHTNSPVFLYSNGKNQFFDTNYNHTFFRLLEGKYYTWTGSKNSIFPPSFSAGLVILSNQ